MKNLLSIRSYSANPVSHSHDFNQVVLPLRGVINIQVENFNGKVSPRECVVVRAKEKHLFVFAHASPIGSVLFPPSRFCNVLV